MLTYVDIKGEKSLKLLAAAHNAAQKNYSNI